MRHENGGTKPVEYTLPAIWGAQGYSNRNNWSHCAWVLGVVSIVTVMVPWLR